MNHRICQKATCVSTCVIALLFIAAMFSPARAGTIEKGKRPPISPAWVFSHWVWEDDENTEKAIWDMINGYEKYGIPVGAVIIDSPWSMEYNNYIFNKKQYSDPAAMIKKLHAKGVRVILWTSSVHNLITDSGDFEPTTHSVYDEGLAKGYFCAKGKPTKWWKGEGAFIDFTNPEAVEWWHSLMDRALDLGVDGWKCDGTDPMFPAGEMCKSGSMTSTKYKDLYYSDMYEHTLDKNPQGVALSRSVDLLPANPKGFAPISHSPVNWVGDQRHNWGTDGFLEALQNIFDSAKLGYTVVGSDTAGYNGSEKISKQLLLRWSQFSTFCPLFENGGHGAHEPWLFDDETVRIYRQFVKIHYELLPYLYSMMMKGHLDKGPIMHVMPGKWQYRLGDHIFVSVMYTPDNNREVTFPKGRWRDLWNPDKIYAEKESIDYKCPISRYPVFLREGSIVPLLVTDGETGHGDASFKDKVTLEITPGGDSTFDLYEEGRQKIELAMKMNGKNFTVTASDGTRPFIVRAYSATAPKSVSANGKQLKKAKQLKGLGKQNGFWFHDAKAKHVYINPGAPKSLKIDVKY